MKVQLGNQMLKTIVAQNLGINPLWNEDFLFVVADPFEEKSILTGENREGPNKDEVMGKTRIPLSLLPICLDHKVIPNKWYFL